MSTITNPLEQLKFKIATPSVFLWVSETIQSPGIMWHFYKANYTDYLV